MGDWLLRVRNFCLLPNENEEIDAEDESFLSVIRPPGAAKELIEDIAVKVDAIAS